MQNFLLFLIFNLLKELTIIISYQLCQFLIIKLLSVNSKIF